MKHSKTALVAACVLVLSLGLVVLFRYLSPVTVQSLVRLPAATQLQSDKQKRFPDALIIGAAKAGTGALRDFLFLHPDVRSADRELHYFDRKTNFEQGINFYLSNLPAVLDTEVLIEKTPAYFVTPGLPRVIYTIQPSVKLLLIVRDPIDRLVSDYLQIAEKRKSSGFPEQSLKDVVYFPSKSNSTPTIRQESTYVRSSLYCIHMVEWLRYFPRDQILVLSGEQFIKSPYEGLKAAEKFLGLEPFFTPNQFVYVQTKGFFCIEESRVGRGTGITCLGDTKGRPHPPVDDDITRDLRAFFSNYTHEFEQQTGMSFGWSTNADTDSTD